MDETALLRARIAEAPFSPDAWPDLLSDIAQAMGGWGAQLVGVANGQFAVDIYGGFTADLAEELHRRGGADPSLNPRAAQLMEGAVGALQCDSEYLTARDRDRYAIYREFFDKVDASYCTLARLSGGDDVALGFAMVHARKQGAPDANTRKRLHVLLPELESAVSLQMRIELQAGATSFSVLESMALPAFVINFAGRIVRTSDAGEAMLTEAGLVRRTNGHLQACHEASDSELQAAVAFATLPNAPRASSVLLRARDGSRLRRADVAPLLGGGRFGLNERALVVVARGERQHSRETLEKLGLTRAEGEVAAALAEGVRLSEIARRRNVSVGTTRAQVKAIFAKLGVSRQAELAAKLAAVT